MRIVQVHSSDIGGGAEVVPRVHHEELLRRGYDSRLIVARSEVGGEGVEKIPFEKGIKGLLRTTRWIERTTGLQYLYSPSFRQLLRRLPREADIVHLHSLHGADGYADLAKIGTLSRHLPVLLSLHDLWLLTGHCALPLDCPRWETGCGSCPDLVRYPRVTRDATRLNWYRKKWALHRTSVQCIAPSNWVADQARRSPILGALPIHVVFNPLDIRLFSPGSKSEARERLQLPHGKQIVLLVAQNLNNPFKGLAEGISSIRLLEHPALFLVAIGRDAQVAIDQCGIPGVAVPYQASQAGLVDYYRAADLFLLPSRSETFGMVAAEAMACGTPVVAFRTGGVPDVLGENVGGLLVPPGDVRLMASAMSKLLMDDVARRAFSLAAVARASSQFSLTQYTDRCLRIYNDALAA